MNTLKQALKLLNGFPSAGPGEQRRRIAQVDRYLKSAQTKRKAALLTLSETDQLRKTRSYMLISSGRTDDGVGEIKSLVDEYVKAIANLHDQAAFQLAEAAIACFRENHHIAAGEFARSALMHAGMAKQISPIVLEALELLQKLQESNNRSNGPKIRAGS